jgi:antitoxin VapB
MALNIKDPETELLASQVAALTGETKTRAVKVALEQRRQRLTARPERRGRAERLRTFLAEEAWPQLPAGMLGAPISKQEREDILGYGPEGV